MKRKVSQLCLIITFALFAGYNTHMAQSAKDEKVSDLTQANIEALTIREWDPIKGWLCFWDVYDDESSSTFFICQRCGNCYTTSATRVHGQAYCWH